MRMIGLDTEGDSRDVRVSKPWSVQVSFAPGSGVSLQVEDPEFGRGIKALQKLVDSGVTVAVHNYLYDGPMCQKMGLDLSRAEIIDTMYSAYLTRIEPQGLKALAWRHCGMQMREYEDVVGDAALSKQAAYLMKVLLWKGCPDPPMIYTQLNDGNAELKQPQNVRRLVGAIFSDYGADKVTKTDGPVDLYKRWTRIDPRVRQAAEERFGPMPVGTLADVDLVEATRYACQDADAALRLAVKGVGA